MTNAYTQTKDGIPIPNPAGQGKRDQMKMTTQDIYQATCALLRDILQLQYQLEPEDFSDPEHYTQAVAGCRKAFELADQIYLWAGTNHIGVGWPECKSNLVIRCDTTSSTSTKEAS